MTEFPSQENLCDMVARWLPPHQIPKHFRIHTDTTDFFRVEYDDVVILGDRPYLIRHNAKEQRYGLEDEVKMWVKRSIDLLNGELKIIKLVFFEKFVTSIAGVEFECFRSPKKEGRILGVVQDHVNFMHGFSIEDEKENLIRVLDFIKGKTLAAHVADINMEHESYFYEQFPKILDNVIECIEAIRFLHEKGEKHGDIRRDHIIIERNGGAYRWIDFDFNYRHRENVYGYDIFGLGNILMFLVGKGDVIYKELKRMDHHALGELLEEDLNIVFKNRIANLKKIYPYIPNKLNRILLHFSVGTHWFYESTSQLLDDLKECREEL